MAGRWVDVAEAGRELGISTDAVRKRISRGSLESDRPNGNVMVWLEDGGTEAGREAQVDGGALVESLRDQVVYLREIVATRDEEIQRRDVIISQLTQRIPELPAAAAGPPSEPRGSPESPGPADIPTDDAGVGPETATERPDERSWWRRLFGGG
jgi:hypothetical protein